MQQPLLNGTEKQGKQQQKWTKIAKNETDSDRSLNYFSHLTLYLSKKLRHCFKSFDIFEKTSVFFTLWQELITTTVESGIYSDDRVSLRSTWLALNLTGAELGKMENNYVYSGH